MRGKICFKAGFFLRGISAVLWYISDITRKGQCFLFIMYWYFLRIIQALLRMHLFLFIITRFWSA